ncbi:MAG TPA: sugar kinase [Rhodothermales bacterium]|nr:sugar kinase [Rhodothermales bacterium]
MKVVTFGEVLLRLSPPGFQRFVQASTLEIYAGGAEANVAVALAQWGAKAIHVSRVPAHEVGELALGALRRYGVDTRHVLRGGERMGLYYLENGASQRGPKVIYDRAGSSFTDLQGGLVDWPAVLDGADWFLWSGITAALGDGPRAVLREALDAARRQGVKVAVDLNYRAKLWTVDEARAAMRPLVEGADLCVAGREDADHTLGLASGATTDDPTDPAYEALAARLRQTLGFGAVAIALRESFSASRHGFSALLHTGEGPALRSRRYEVALVDRVGGGDAFTAGLLYGLHHRTPAEALEFAVAASCLKQTMPGDFAHVSVEEVERLAGSGAGGRVER